MILTYSLGEKGKWRFGVCGTSVVERFVYGTVEEPPLWLWLRGPARLAFPSHPAARSSANRSNEIVIFRFNKGTVSFLF
jgi:hypothetical protein